MSFFRMKRRQFLHSSYFLTGLGLSACGLAVSSSKESLAYKVATRGKMKVYAWENYVNHQVSEEFTKATSIKLIVDTYPDQETMLAKIEGGGGAGYSVVYPRDYITKQMIDIGLLEPLDKSKLTAIADIAENFTQPYYDPDNTYSIPYVWGTTGIIYNSTALKTAPTNWQSLWDLKDQLKNRISLLGDGREVIGMTLHTLGYSYNSRNEAQIKAAYKKLRELKSAVTAFTSHEWQEKLVKGELVLSMAYSGDALAVSSQYPNLKYVIPQSGTSLWNSTMVILKTAPAKEAAYDWINFSLKAENSASVIEASGFGNLNKAATPLISDKIKNKPDWAPSKEVLAKCERIQPLDDATQTLLNEYWFRLKSV
ncbi:ABC transporter substrate-binding protein [Iningainema tapete]|uniref:Spermidine/putrescine ABC transporter substrate-binding protein n=1 Tax=Iningainema tapete BLCC-T55 TaxID=2748662 RepID=A0A8J6XFF3_9CYAN|nr:spermidine/putrescine ABC transporter substrate-binding protein [Iningainema tapete]MBD2775640.1 spermidine/putrescine ABC transporter substrate-binding protein [Iningainema tapete BLCC-T55]